MRFIVYGAGAIGGTIGGHLFRAGYNVVLVANPKHVAKINEAGLKLVTADETYILEIPAYKEAKELESFQHDDVVLLTAKSQQTLNCLGQLKNAGAPRTLPIFCVQNSILNESLATRIFNRIYGCVIVIPGIFLDPGVVINPITQNYGFIEVGRYPQGVDKLAHQVSSALKTAGFASTINKEVMKAKGAKCLYWNLGSAMEAITDGKGDSNVRNKFMEEARQ
ncbi:MAG: NAD(P)-binding domain-containing protein, partial [Candidatus Bathyarchaeota archaeon]